MAISARMETTVPHVYLTLIVFQIIAIPQTIFISAQGQPPAEVHALIIPTAPPINAYMFMVIMVHILLIGISAMTEVTVRRAYPTLIAIHLIA